ncbi:MAG: hypothetical protein EZS28_016943 [Streblomastix strix]|uniref:Uncharacterized protein n=1 Tax=Streblomastix strix TaxID=222440 RepID=A0A5J4VZ50_9EUKA|nr:MAG: hypothetical protein EZS28_016943 [Streblomastix strix]
MIITDNVQLKLALFSKQPFKALVRLLELPDKLVANDAINSIANIHLGGTSSTADSEIHPHFAVFQECDGIIKIFSLFKRHESMKDNKNASAICIGILYKVQDITDPEMRKTVIAHLKLLINDSNSWAKTQAKKMLTVNKTEIEADGFTLPN